MGQRGSREKEEKKNKDRKEDDKAQSEIRIVLPIGSIPPLKSINKIKGNI